jgi:sugar phosphate isomerase/epimerase
MKQANPNTARFGCCGSMISPATDPVGGEIVESLARFGFDYIELSLAHLTALPEGEFDGLQKRLERSGITCEACNNFFPPSVRLTGPEARLSAALEYANGALGRAARLGGRIVVFGSSGAKNVPQGFPVDAAWQQIRELLGHLGSMAARQGITIVIEPLCKQESNLVNNAAEGLRLAREVDHPNIRLLIDYYHLMMEHEDPDILLEAGPMIRHLHFAQVAGRAFPQDPDDGYVRFFDRLRRIGYAGRCSIEAYTRDFAAEAPRALGLLKTTATGPRV